MPLAQDTKAPAKNSGATAMPPRSSMKMGDQMGQMDEHMKKMQALHDKMTTATTPEERQKVMDEQRNEMHSAMSMMNQMMRGGGMMGGGLMGQKDKPADQATQMQMMQKRMDMMQMMMQMMMDQQGMMPLPARPDSAPKK
jgi:hypothetical protein